MSADLDPERLAEIKALVRNETSIAFYSNRAKESVLLLIAEVERLRAAESEMADVIAGTGLNLHEEEQETARLRAELVALKRPDIARRQRKDRESYEALIAQAREDKDFEGAFDVEVKLAEAESRWRRENDEVTS